MALVSSQQTPALPRDVLVETGHFPMPKPALFEWPPETVTKRSETPLPIMARLPVAEGEDEEKEEHDPSAPYLRVEQDTPQPPGTLRYDASNEGVTYTVSRLPSIDSASLDLWNALHAFRPLSTNYTSAILTIDPLSSQPPQKCPMSSSPSSNHIRLLRTLFNWALLRLSPTTEKTFYGVLFLSRRAANSPSENLYAADKRAHEEAVRAGGLIMYFYGLPDPISGTNLATCVWSSRGDARSGASGVQHGVAVGLAREVYGWFEVGRYAVVKKGGEEGVRVEEWSDDEEE